MKAMILAAGLGTRLKPWTLSHPKALVPVGGTPMLARVMKRLETAGFDELTVNIHHFGGQILDFLQETGYAGKVNVSDERALLMDTGGGLVAAAPFLCADERPFLVHNVDILSDADVAGLMRAHEDCGADVTMLVSGRKSSRRLIFSPGMRLRGWHNLATEEYRPGNFENERGDEDKELAFSGIYVVSPSVVRRMKEERGTKPFPVMDFLLDNVDKLRIFGFFSPGLKLIDIGKPETLAEARHLFDDSSK